MTDWRKDKYADGGGVVNASEENGKVEVAEVVREVYVRYNSDW